jgi:hypothetical protein
MFANRTDHQVYRASMSAVEYLPDMTAMTEHCFREKGTDPPVCGLHKVRLARGQSAEVVPIAGLKNFSFLVCPVSGEVLSG